MRALGHFFLLDTHVGSTSVLKVTHHHHFGSSHFHSKSLCYLTPEEVFVACAFVFCFPLRFRRLVPIFSFRVVCCRTSRSKILAENVRRWLPDTKKEVLGSRTDQGRKGFGGCHYDWSERMDVKVLLRDRCVDPVAMQAMFL